MSSKSYYKIIVIVSLIVLFFAMSFYISFPEMPANTEASTSVSQVTPTATVTATTTVASITIDRILERGYLIVGVKCDFPPFGLCDEAEAQESFEGFDVDIVKDFARRWLGGEDKVTFKKVTSEDRIDLLLAGEIDLIAASMTHVENEERDKVIDFSQTYFLDGQSILLYPNLENDENKEIRLNDLNSCKDEEEKAIAALQGSTSLENIETENKKRELCLIILPYQEVDEAFQWLLEDVVYGFTSDRSFLLQLKQKHDDNGSSNDVNRELIVIEEVFTEEPYALGVLEGDSKFRELVNATLQDMKKDGTYDALYTKWFFDTDKKDWLSGRPPYPIQIIPGEANYLPFTTTRSITSQIELIRMRGNVLVAGVKNDLKPFGFIDDQEQLTGFDVELMRAMAEEWGVEIRFEKVTSADRIDKLLAREVDILAATMTKNPIRDELIDFSDIYFLDGQSVLYRTDLGLVKELSDLEGEIVAALKGSTSLENLNEIIEQEGLDIEVKEYVETSQIIADLADNKIAAFTSDRGALSAIAEDHDDLAVLDSKFTDEPYGLGVPEGDTEFQTLVNCTLQKLKEDGKYKEIYQDWFDEAPFVIQNSEDECPVSLKISQE